MKKTVKFLYKETDIVFGKYDIMFPQTEDNKNTVVEFDGDVELKDYFSQFVNWLTKIGFNEIEIIEQIRRYCNYQDEISSSSTKRV